LCVYFISCIIFRLDLFILCFTKNTCLHNLTDFKIPNHPRKTMLRCMLITLLMNTIVWNIIFSNYNNIRWFKCCRNKNLFNVFVLCNFIIYYIFNYLFCVSHKTLVYITRLTLKYLTIQEKQCHVSCLSLCWWNYCMDYYIF
jgi:hypothetical protein